MKIDSIELIKFLTKETKDIELEPGFNMWLNHVKINRRPATYQFYKCKVSRLLTYFNERNIYSFQKLDSVVMANYIVYCKNRGLKNTTINKTVIMIKSTINYLVNLDIITPINLKTEKLKEETPNIETISPENLKLIIEYLEAKGDPSMYCAFMLMLTTGVRRTELINIQVKNIDLKSDQIYLERTKNGHPRYIYILDDKIKSLIVETMTQYPNQDYLFYSRLENKRATTSTIDNYFHKIKRDLGISTLSPHKLRHTYATMLIEQGADYNSVRLLLGHETWDMTKRYIQVKNSKLHAINNSFNPMNCIKKAWGTPASTSRKIKL